MCAAINEKQEPKHQANMLHMMAVLEQEGPALAERSVSTLFGSFLRLASTYHATAIRNRRHHLLLVQK